MVSVLSLLLLADGALAVRHVKKTESREAFPSFPWSNKAKHIACPVMGALVNDGIIKMDRKGRITQEDTMKGLMWTGNSEEMAGFQARGIAAFKDSDPHEEYRERFGGYSGTLYLNYQIWNPLSECKDGKSKDPNGFECNANIGFQQHAWSTTLRDPTDGSSADARWNRWMGKSGVLTHIGGVSEKVMTIEGLATLLKEARLHGSKHGEFSLSANNGFDGSPMAFYHAHANVPQKYLPVSQWQAVTAWSAFFQLFARVSNGVLYMPESDLRRFFYDAKFPKDWTPKPWGFKESFKTIRMMKGMGAGDEWADIITGVLAAVGDDASEENCLGGMLKSLQGVGAFDDDTFKHYPR